MLESALAHFIQNKLYLQYIFIISLYSYILSFFYVILARKADMYKTALNVDNDSGNIFERFPYNLLWNIFLGFLNIFFFLLSVS